jgi:hypothetical protein
LVGLCGTTNNYIPRVYDLPGVLAPYNGVHFQDSANGLTDYFNITFYGPFGFQVIPEFNKSLFSAGKD